MSPKTREPAADEIIRFIADHEALKVTLDEYPNLKEDRLRTLLRDFVRPIKPAKMKREQSKPGAGVPTKVLLYTDGAARGNPGPAGAGWVICDSSGQLVRNGNAYVGERTNNEAEYEALILGLQAVLDLGSKQVIIRADSELLVRQLNGQYQVKNARLAQLYDAARTLILRFRKFEIQHIRREQNGAADAQANLAIDER